MDHSIVRYGTIMIELAARLQALALYDIRWLNSETVIAKPVLSGALRRCEHLLSSHVAMFPG